ncbi:MAG: hypothetical protein J6X22_00240 [Muribaculaceae bacterium]|nr:hypothetical protein [Muribaculaceae bacterium]
MEKESKSIKRIRIFKDESLHYLELTINCFISRYIDKLELINVSITYNRDTEEYIACVTFLLYNKDDYDKLETPSFYDRKDFD